MATVLKHRVVAGLALTLLLLMAGYAWGLFFTSGTLGFTFVRTWGESGAGPGQFDGPIGVAVGPNADIYVTDAGNNRIQRFRPDGTFVAAWGEQGSELGHLAPESGQHGLVRNAVLLGECCRLAVRLEHMQLLRPWVDHPDAIDAHLQILAGHPQRQPLRI